MSFKDQLGTRRTDKGENKMPEINKLIDEVPFYLTKKVSEGAADEPGAVNLSRGQAGFLPPLDMYEEAKRIIDSGDKTLFRYEKSAGSPELRKAMSQWYERLYGLKVVPEHIAITVGGTGAITLAFMMFTNPGDEIIIPDPSYPFYMLSASYGLENRIIKRLFIGKDGVTGENLQAVISHKTKLVVITNPNNPNGFFYDEKALVEIVELARKKDFFIICDENHFPELYDGRKHVPLSLIDRKNSIVLGSLSRYALQGERIGWAILPDNPKGLLSKFIAHSPYAATTAQKLGTFFFKNYESLGFEKYFIEYEEKRNWLIPELNKIEGFQCHMPAGTSYAFVNIRKFADKNKDKLTLVVKKEMEKRSLPEEEIELAMKYKSILVNKYLLYCVGVGTVPGIAYGPGSDNYIRFTFSVDKEELEIAAARLKNIFKGL